MLGLKGQFKKIEHVAIIYPPSFHSKPAWLFWNIKEDILKNVSNQLKNSFGYTSIYNIPQKKVIPVWNINNDRIQEFSEFLSDLSPLIP